MAEDLLLSLPPLESRDLALLKKHCQTLFGEELDDSAVRERACLDESNTSTDLARALQAALADTQSRLAADTKRFTIKSEESNLVVRTYVEKIDSHNWGTGYWASTWILKPAGDTAILSGTIQAHVYNFEDGNVQQKSRKEIEDTVVVGGAEEIVKQMKGFERQFWEELQDEEPMMISLKQIRRILPITRTRMKWDAAAQRQVTLLNARNTN